MLLAILGAGRNGSSLLMRLLDGSPDLWIHPVEVNYLSFWSDLTRFGFVRRQSATNSTTESSLQLDARLDTETLLRTFGTHFEEIQTNYLPQLVEPFEPNLTPAKRLDHRASYSAEEFLPELLESARVAYDQRDSTPAMLGFKSIETPYIAEYARTFPSARFLHIVRDPVANYSSLKRTNIRKGWPFWQHGGDELAMFVEKRWLPHARFVVDACEADSSKHLLVRYEDLCAKPQEVMERVCGWLGVSAPSDPTLQTVLGGRRMSRFPDRPSKEGIDAPERVVASMADQFVYAEVVTARERGFILSRTYDHASRLGYFGDQARPSLGARLDLARRWLLPDGGELMNARSKPRLARALLARRWYLYRSLFL